MSACTQESCVADGGKRTKFDGKSAGKVQSLPSGSPSLSSHITNHWEFMADTVGLLLASKAKVKCTRSVLFCCLHVYIEKSNTFQLALNAKNIWLFTGKD